MEDTCCVLRPYLVLKIDRRQNILYRPDLVPLLENMAIALALVDKANHVFWKLRFLSVANGVFNSDLLPTYFNSGNWSRSVIMHIALLHIQFVQCWKKKKIIWFPHASDKIRFRSARFDICQPVTLTLPACLYCVLRQFPEVTFHIP